MPWSKQVLADTRESVYYYDTDKKHAYQTNFLKLTVVMIKKKSYKKCYS